MSIIITAVAFACMLSGSLSGVFIRKRLPAHHRSEASRDILKASVGLIGTLVALVLGLLVSSAKSRFDSMDAGIIKAGAECILLDRNLAHYGPEAKQCRDRLRQVVSSATESIWPTNASNARDLESLESSARMEDVERMLRELTPRTESQRAIHAQALQITGDILQTRWLLLTQSQYSIPTLFLVILILWLMALYTGLGLLAPGHATAILSLCISAASVSGAVFLVLELSDPLGGFVKISGGPLVKALSIMGQ